MILHSLKLQGCRCFRNSIAVGPFSAGLNLLVGPNEAGKSTLVEAVARALFDRYNVGGKAIALLQPWGSNLAPEITLEIEEGDERYRLYKRLISKPQAELERLESGVYQRLQQNEGVDAFVRGLMLAEAPGNRLSEPTQWGLARTLWFLQRCPVGDPGATETMRERLQEALGAQPAAPERGLMGGKIESLYGAVFTGTGRLAQQSALARIVGRYTEAQARLGELQLQYDEALQYEAQLGDLQGQHQAVAEERAEAETGVQELEKLAEVLKEQRQALEQLTQALATAAQERKMLQATVKKYQATQTELEAERQRQGGLESKLMAATIQKEAASRLREEAVAAAGVRKRACEQAQQLLERARALGLARDLAARERFLRDVVTGLEQLDDRLRQLKAAYDQQLWPQRGEVDTARTLQTTVAVEQARLQAVGLSLEVALESEQSVAVTVDGQTDGYEGNPDDVRVFHAAQSAEIALPGVARLRVRSGAEETVAVSERVQAAEAELAGLLGKFACPTVEALASRCAEGEGQQQQIQELQKDLKRQAGDYKTLPQARGALAETTNKLDAALGGLQLTRETLAETPAEDEARLSFAARTAEAARNEADGVLQQRQADLVDAIKLENECRQAASDAASRCSGHQKAIEGLLTASGCATLPDLEDRLSQAESKETALGEQVAALTASLPNELDDPAEQLVTAREALGSLDQEQRKLEDDILTTRNRLETAREGDPYGRKLLAEEELERLRSEVNSELLRAGSVRLLRELYAARRQGVAAPWADLEERCGRMLNSITGRPRQVRLSPEWGLQQVREGEEWVDWSQLSSGAQEQLQLAYRLALGEAYADRFGRQMLVLDDVLVYTDPARHKRLLEILKIGAQKLQIFILTSHVSFYRGLVADEFIFDLPTLAQGAGD